MNEENKISVVINTYNAEEYLVKVLDAVKDFDEIVLCDMESTDNTCEIAKKYGCSIVTFPKGHFTIAEPARTFAIQSAKYKWILVVDADEIVTPELHDYLYKRIQDNKCPNGLYIQRRNKFMGKFIHSSPDYQLRFFIREGSTWPPYVHTMPVVKGITEKIPLSLKDVQLTHLADEDIKGYLEKMDRYTDMEVEKKAMRKHYGFKSIFFRPIWFFFRTYFINGGFKDGKRGFIRCVLNATYQFVFISKVIEKRYKGRINL
jgi:glycosyltransferase involved in cell wall biosynthesis